MGKEAPPEGEKPRFTRRLVGSKGTKRLTPQQSTRDGGEKFFGGGSRVSEQNRYAKKDRFLSLEKRVLEKKEKEAIILTGGGRKVSTA